MVDRVVVLVPPPTANGDLHVGHLAGPFLASDVYARYARAIGMDVLYSTGIQDTPTYVVVTARRLGTAPEQLAAESSSAVRRTLDELGISVDGFGSRDDRFQKLLLDFLGPLHSGGKFRLRSMSFPYLPKTGEYLMDAYVRGNCPICLAEGCGGVCETCGHRNNPGDIIGPRSIEHPDEPVEIRRVPVLVFPLEQYRNRLIAHFERCAAGLRPHLRQMVREMLGRPLPDLPITYPTNWGVPAPFPEVWNQVINPCGGLEALAWSMYSTAIAAEQRGAALNSDDEPWLAESDARVVYFCGFDNTQPFAIAGPALLMAHGDRYRLPEQFITNEFYELDYEKFSTSRGHVVWARDLAAEVPRDLIRFFLAATSPEQQRTNFSRSALAKVVNSRLVEPWNRLAAKVNALLGQQLERSSLPVSQRARTTAKVIIDRFTAGYELAGFSLNRTAETIGSQLAWLERRTATRDDLGDLCYEVEVFLRCAAPVLIDLAGQVLGETTIPVRELADEVRPRWLPALARQAGAA